MMRLVPATRQHCLEVASELRPEDEAECRARFGGGAAEQIVRSWLCSPFCVAGVDEDGRALGVCGVSREDAEWWCPWLVGTTELDRRLRELARLSLLLFPLFAARFPRMRNVVAAENKRSVRWLARLGFEFYGREYINGCEFLQFRFGEERGEGLCALLRH